MAVSARSAPRLALAATLLLIAVMFLTAAPPRADAVDGPVDVVYIASGRNFPDALAGSTLATTLRAPLLTVEPRLPLPPATVAALEALDPAAIIVFGGPAAVSSEVIEALLSFARTGSVTRISGDDRHDTAAKIAEALPNPSPIDAATLDGLDSGDFLRSNATLDAATLDGRSAAAYRGFSLPIQAAATDGNASLSLASLTLSAAGSSSMIIGFALPNGYVGGDPIEVVFPIQTSPSCAVVLSASGVSGPDDDSLRVLNYGWSLVGGGDLVALGPAPSGTSSATTKVAFRLNHNDNLSPGAAVTFRLTRAGADDRDTCEGVFVYGGIAVNL